MNEQYELLYGEMLGEITRCMAIDLSEPEKINECFWIASNGWERLKDLVRAAPFRRKEEEIYFFKHIKPRFTSHIQYFTIISEAWLFLPDTDGERFFYWQEEIKRLDRFREINRQFVEYYESGATNLDNEWFERMTGEPRPVLRNVSYDADIAFTSRYDPLVRALLAHRMYHEYAKNKWEQMKLKK